LNKIRLTNLEEDISKIVKLKIGQALKKSNIEKEINELIITEIQENGIKPELEESSIKTRQYLAQYNTTDKKYSPAKSNLTLTGALLKSFKTPHLIFYFQIVLCKSLALRYTKGKL
jgi:hypothetical protein